MTFTPYFGNAPYCYTNTLLTALQRPDLTPGLVETLTGSPFGFQLLVGRWPLFDPLGWHPNLGLDQALHLLGYSWETRSFSTEGAALAGLNVALASGPVFVGPVDMGFLKHQPESDRASGADHFVTVLGVCGETVEMHDPQGHPWAALPLKLFMRAWRAEHLGYSEPFTLRAALEPRRQVAALEALRASLPLAARWSRGWDALPSPSGTLGGQEGLKRLAEWAAQGPTEDVSAMLVQFSIRVGARRKTDAAQVLQQLGQTAVAEVLQRQARVLGALQYPALLGEGEKLSSGFTQLGELEGELMQALAEAAP